MTIHPMRNFCPYAAICGEPEIGGAYPSGTIVDLAKQFPWED